MNMYDVTHILLHFKYVISPFSFQRYLKYNACIAFFFVLLFVRFNKMNNRDCLRT